MADRPSSNHHHLNLVISVILADLDVGLTLMTIFSSQPARASNSSVATGYGLQNMPRTQVRLGERTRLCGFRQFGHQLASGRVPAERIRRKCIDL
jgi:hypothetical protein